MSSWPEAIFEELGALEVRQVAFVPDAGHARLIALCADHPEMQSVPLTTEEEGVALLAGAWLGGQRGVLLMQSSGAGNCINMLSLIHACRFPLLTLVTMRGEWGEFNPWQLHMGQRGPGIIEATGTIVHRVEQADEAAPIVRAAGKMAFEAQTAVAVLIGQAVIGAKAFGR